MRLTGNAGWASAKNKSDKERIAKISTDRQSQQRVFRFIKNNSDDMIRKTKTKLYNTRWVKKLLKN